MEKFTPLPAGQKNKDFEWDKNVEGKRVNAFGLCIIPCPSHGLMGPCTKTMASKKFSTWVVLFILILSASKVAFMKVLGTSELGDSSKSAIILGFYFQFVSSFKKQRERKLYSSNHTINSHNKLMCQSITIQNKKKLY